MPQHENGYISEMRECFFAPNVAHLFYIQLCTKCVCCFMLYLPNVRQIDGNTTFKNEFRN